MLILLSSPVLLRVFLLVGMLIWLLRILWGAGLTPDATCRFSREEGTGSRRDFLLAVRMHWLLQMLVLLLIGGSPLISLLLLASVLMLGWLMLLVR